MNSIERIKLALAHQEADHVPCCPVLSGVTRNLTNTPYPVWSTDADACARSFIAAADEVKPDCLITLVDLSIECDAWGAKIIYPENDAAHPDYSQCVIGDIDEYDKIRKVDYRQSKRMQMQLEVCRQLVAAKGKEMPIIAFVFGPLGTLSMLRSQQELYMDVYDDPDAVREAAREINETLKEYAAALCDTGVDGIMFDTLMSSGSIMSKSMWDEMEGDLVEELAQVVHDKGKAVFIHNCGQMIYMDVQIQRMKPEGISFLYPADDCRDFAETKAKYGSKTTLIGAVNPADAILGTDAEWDAQCKAQIDAMAAGGGFILATGCEYPSGASLYRAKRMMTIARTYGAYNK